MSVAVILGRLGKGMSSWWSLLRSRVRTHHSESCLGESLRSRLCLKDTPSFLILGSGWEAWDKRLCIALSTIPCYLALRALFPILPQTTVTPTSLSSLLDSGFSSLLFLAPYGHTIFVDSVSPLPHSDMYHSAS